MPPSKKKITTSKLSFDESEWSRLQELTVFETTARQKGYQLIAGIDEAGRGPLAGPVVAAACIIPDGIFFAGIDDSKKLTAPKRAELYEQLTSDLRVSYGIGIISSEEIDAVNIYQATILAMLQAVAQLTIMPEILLVDGLLLPHPKIPTQKIVGGDAKSQSIAAASILAKETRDQLMRDFHRTWPCYGFNQHKGYGTAKHLEALSAYGPCPIHRKSFEPVKACKEVAHGVPV